MAHTDDRSQTRSWPFAAWIGEPSLHADVVDILSDALGHDWAVERHVDYEGEASIIVFPKADPDSGPSFILFEQNGEAVVATIRFDEWQGACAFPGVDAAAGAVVTEAGLFFRACAKAGILRQADLSALLI